MIIRHLKEIGRDCVGCGNCVRCCPTKTIKLIINNEGFFDIELDEFKCDNCGKCMDSCPQVSYSPHTTRQPECFVAASDNEYHDKSTAGGVFGVLADKFIGNGGYVCGVAMVDDRAVYKIISTKNDLKELIGAKYIEADLQNCFETISKLLASDKSVMFCGTPCHVVALKKYISKDYSDKLVTVDFVCHGVSSPKMIDSIYAQLANSKLNPVGIDFSNKSDGFRPDLCRLELKDGKTLDYSEFSYFHNNCISLNKACYNCQFASLPRISDITLGIFYGIEQHNAKFNVQNGVSEIIVNSTKGKTLLLSAKSEFTDFKPVPLRFAVQNNRFFSQYQLIDVRDRFFDLLNDKLPLNEIHQYIDSGRFDVGVVTNWSTCNFGAHMTHYAMYRLLKSINLQPIMIEKPNTHPYPPLPEPILFRKNPYPSFATAPLAGSIEELRKYNNECDTFIVGSDQVWNQVLFNHAFDTFTLAFVDDEKPKFSVATSFGSDSFLNDENLRNIFKERISRFNGVSVREASGKTIMKNIFGVDSEMILDPVLLVDPCIYDEIISVSKFNKKSPYIFAFLFWIKPYKERMMMDYAENRNLDLICASDILHNAGMERKKWALPTVDLFVEDWLCYLKNAEFIFTDSFHTVCFAILFKKDFVCIVDPEIDGSCRMYSLLSQLGLENRIVDDVSKVYNSDYTINSDIFKNIDYKEVHDKLIKLQKKSQKWIYDSLYTVFGEKIKKKSNDETRKKK